MTTFHVYAAADGAGADVKLRQIGIADVIDAVRLGYEDFSEKPSHYVFLCVIYPIVGIFLIRWVLGGNALQMIFPLMAGFALLGPLAAIGLYEISRRREAHIDTSWKHALEVLRSPALPSILAVGAMLLVLFVIWLYVAQVLYTSAFGDTAPRSLTGFIAEVITTRAGWTLLIVGNAIGFVFALAALVTTNIAFPLMLDRDVGAVASVKASIQAFMLNPLPLSVWGLIVAGGLVAGAATLLVGLVVVLPVLGHSTGHLYRKVVEPAAPVPAAAAARGRRKKT
jgi:uncharacterized membrane protein